MPQNLQNAKFSLGSQAGLWLGAALGLGAYLGLVLLDYRTGTLRAGNTPHTVGWHLLAFCGYGLAVGWLEWRRGGSVYLIWGAAILFRLLLLFTTPTLSDDVYRYIWDGYVANQGISPYAHAIDSPELDYLDIPQRALANNRWMASPYLPTAQFLFFGLTRLSLKPLTIQITMVLFDLLAGWLIVKLLTLAHLPSYRVLLYLWNPLVVVEVAHGAHLDAMMVCLALGAVWLTYRVPQPPPPLNPPQRGGGGFGSPLPWGECLCKAEGLGVRGIFPPLLLALAILTKILPAFLLVVLFWRWRWRQLILYGLAVVGLMLPFGLSVGWGLRGPLDGVGVFGAIRIYAAHWNFNSGLFHWLEVKWLPLWGVADPLTIAKQIVGGMQLAVLGAVWLLARSQRDNLVVSLRLMAIPFMAYLLLATTVNPWYALILLIFLPFLAPSTDESPWLWLILLPWLYLSASLSLSYITYFNPNDFREFEWVRNWEWMPVWGLVGVTLIGWGSRSVSRRK